MAAVLVLCAMAHERNVTVARELLVLRQLEIRRRVFGLEPVSKPHVAPVEARDAIAAVNAQTLEMKGRGHIVAALQLSRPALFRG